jgi:diguanylate cyclase (GGDEF)-like protein
MGAYLQRHLRSEDQAYRYGGEEFVLLLPQTGAFGMRRMLERLGADRSSLCQECRMEISFSAGVALYPEDGSSIQDLLAVADRRMYQAKLEGRGRLCTALGCLNLF